MEHGFWIASLAIATLSDGRVVVVSGATDGTVRLWHAKRRTWAAIGGPLPTRDGSMGDHAMAVASLPDGRSVIATAASKGQGTVRLWDVATARPVGAEICVPDASIPALALGTLADGRAVVIAGTPGSVHIVDVETRVLLATVPVMAWVNSLSFHEGLVAVGAQDGLFVFELGPF